MIVPLSRRLRRAAAAALAAAGLGVAPLAVPAVGAAVAVAQPSAPSQEQVEAQRDVAHRLRSVADQRARDVTEAQRRLDEAARAANAALEVYAAAMREQQEAEAAHWERSEALTAARTRYNASRDDLGRWAARTYREGSGLAAYEGVMTLLEARSPEDLSRRVAMLQVVGRAQQDSVVVAGAAVDEQEDAAAAAERTALRVQETTQAAIDAKEDADRLVAAHDAELSRLRGLLLSSETAVATADAEAERLAEARRQVLAGMTRSAPPVNLDGLDLGDLGVGGNAVTGRTGACTSQGVERFPNGQIPRSALCPLWGAPGHLLRADAAYAFDRLAEAYASTFAEPICVTDSYRTLQSQVRLREQKPALAARPGTSNHGWGTAVDLCGGIERFGTPEHRWMQLNAPRFGWFNPGWAQQDGSKPEPWHWELGA